MTREMLVQSGFSVDPDAYARLERFVAALLDETERVNLTAIRDPADAWVLHVCDSLSLLPLIDRFAPASLLDVGTGGGVPGIPLACARPQLAVTLLDATRKKVDAAGRIAAASSVRNVTTVWGRAETLSQSPPHAGRFDVVVARAVAKLPELVASCAGFLRTSGHALFMKSTHGLAEEIAAAHAVSVRYRLKFLETTTYELPAPHGRRAAVIYQKVRDR